MGGPHGKGLASVAPSPGPPLTPNTRRPARCPCAPSGMPRGRSPQYSAVAHPGGRQGAVLAAGVPNLNPDVQRGSGSIIRGNDGHETSPPTVHRKLNGTDSSCDGESRAGAAITGPGSRVPPPGTIARHGWRAVRARGRRLRLPTRARSAGLARARTERAGGSRLTRAKRIRTSEPPA